MPCPISSSPAPEWPGSRLPRRHAGLGAEPLVVEKLPRPGGSMRLSSGVIWRHRDFDRFREECPDGDERLQRLLFERLDDDLAWLESLGAPVVERDTGNPLTTGTRFDPDGLTARAGRRRPGGVRLGGAASRRGAGTVPLILATGGFAASRDLLRAHVSPRGGPRLPARGAGQHGRRPPDRARGRRRAPAPGSTRCTPARCPRRRRASARATSCGSRSSTRRHATVTNERGERYETRTWSEIDVAQWQLAAAAGARVVHGRRASGSASACASARSPRWSTPPRRRARPSGAAMTM